MMGLNLINQIVCPVCKGSNFSTISEGTLFKKNVLTCNNCKTVMEQSGKADKSIFKVRRVEEEYSNVDRLFRYKSFTIPELSTHELLIVSDSQLEEYAKGNQEGYSIKMAGELTKEIIINKDEKIVLWLSPIDYLESRRKTVSSWMEKYNYNITKGGWYKTTKLPSKYIAITKLDSGVLAFTNQRCLFLGNKINLDLPLTSLGDITPFSDGFCFFMDKRQKTEYFSGKYHWPLMFSIIIGLFKNANELRLEAMNKRWEKILKLTSREAVMKAMEEYDKLGSEEFLHKYHFENTKGNLYIEYEGKCYLCKPIAGVAYGYQYPDQGNLMADEDEDGVISTRALAEFGFTIHHYLLKTNS